mmetsp:Transcript_22795/g.49266  ORF Transcript_22795/g.49266 Transcript_22795/m.49266 type:complete len:325 (+) Transcript_22795:629-1603(+)
MGTHHVPLHPRESQKQIQKQIQKNRRKQKIHPAFVECQTRPPSMRLPHPTSDRPRHGRSRFPPPADGTRIRRSNSETRSERADSTPHHEGTLFQTHPVHHALPVGSGIHRGGGEGGRSRGTRKEEEEGHLPSVERGHHAGVDHDTGHLHGLFDLRHHALHPPGRSHLRNVRRTLVRSVPHRRDALLRGIASQEHRRHQRREGGPTDGPPHQRPGERRRTLRIRPQLPRQIHHTPLRRQDQGDERRVRLGTAPHRHRGARFRHHRSQRAGDDQGGVEPAGSEGARDHEAEGGGRGGAQEHERGERLGCGQGERVQSHPRLRWRDR